MQNLWILAQTETVESTVQSQPETSEVEAQPMNQQGQPVVAVDSNAAAPARPQSPFSGSFSWIFLIVIFAVMFLMLREPRRKQKQHEKMVRAIKKNDKIRTIGGIVGTVVDIKEDEIVLKVDESNNTKIRIVPSAIGKNLSEGQ
jgi:preprotein translocase subunit YajC